MNSREALERLKEILDEDSYTRVMTMLAGTTVYFPENSEWQNKSERNMQLREDFYSGSYEITDLAKKYNLSISRVYKIIQSRK